MPPHSFLSDRDWRNLLREIHSGQVIPVIGPDLIRIENGSGESIPLQQALAPDLAAALGLDEPQRFTRFNDAAREFLLRGGERKELYIELGEIFDRLSVSPSSELLDLAGIHDFRLFIVGTPDPLFVQAVTRARPGFTAKKGVIRFHPAGNPNRSYEAQLSGTFESPCDLPATFAGPKLRLQRLRPPGRQPCRNTPTSFQRAMPLPSASSLSAATR